MYAYNLFIPVPMTVYFYAAGEKKNVIPTQIFYPKTFDVRQFICLHRKKKLKLRCAIVWINKHILHFKYIIKKKKSLYLPPTVICRYT